MEPVISRRKKLPLFLYLINALIWCGAGLLFALAAFEIAEYSVWCAAIAVIFIFLGFFPCKSYLKKTPSIYIDQDKIIFNNKEEICYWSDVDSVQYSVEKTWPPFVMWQIVLFIILIPVLIGADTGGIDAKGPMNDSKKATVLYFKDGKEKRIYESMYNNFPEIKESIVQALLQNEQINKLAYQP